MDVTIAILVAVLMVLWIVLIHNDAVSQAHAVQLGKASCRNEV